MKYRFVNTKLRLYLLAFLGLLLTACETNSTPKPPINDPEQHLAEREAALKALEWFKVSGGLGIWTDDENISARIAWNEAGDTMSLTLVAPLGLGTINLERNEYEAVLTRGNSVIGRGPSADRVLQQGLRLERPIPLNQMSEWLRGLPGDGKNIKRDERERIESLQYRDSEGLTWRARFLSYTQSEGLELPAVITATGGPYNVSLKLREWVLASSDGNTEPGKNPVNEVKSPQRLAIPGQ